jgi:hypothetical protein
VQLVLALPEHRLRPGQTVAYTGLDGTDRVVTLPEWTAPGRTVRLVTAESYGWPHQVELVITQT